MFNVFHRGGVPLTKLSRSQREKLKTGFRITNANQPTHKQGDRECARRLKQMQRAQQG